MNYLQIKVETAKQIARRFNKNQVFIMAWDETSNQVNTTTYGTTRYDADSVKGFADRLMAFIAAEPGEFHEDRRHEHDKPEFDTWWRSNKNNHKQIPEATAFQIWQAARKGP
jgi:hypothetical protein